MRRDRERENEREKEREGGSEGENARARSSERERAHEKAREREREPRGQWESERERDRQREREISVRKGGGGELRERRCRRAGQPCCTSTPSGTSQVRRWMPGTQGKTGPVYKHTHEMTHKEQIRTHKLCTTRPPWETGWGAQGLRARA